MDIPNIDLLFDNNPNPMWVYHPESLEIVQANNVAQKIYGYSRQEFLSMTIKDLHPSDHREKVAQAVENRGDKFNDSRVWEHATKSGRSIFVRIMSHPIQISGENYKLAVATDITEQKRFEKRFQNEQELLQMIVKKMPGAFFLFNKDGIMLKWNQQLEKITGFTKREVSEKPILSYFDQKEHSRINEAIERAFQYGSFEIESKIVRKDGKRVPILFNAASTVYHDEECLVGIGLDITSQVNLLREKEILISEIHHRVKNNLALINSLLYLQASEIKEKSFQQLLNNTQVRIKIIALIHELLYKSESFTNINYGEYLEELIDLIRSVYDFENRLTINFEISSIELNINQALPFSLLINEIFSVIRKDLKESSSNKGLDIKIHEDSEKAHLKLTYGGVFNFTEAPEDEQLNDLLISVLCDQLDASFHYSDGETSTCVIEFEKKKIKGSSAGNIMELI